MKGDEDIVKALLGKSGIAVNDQDASGYTALHRAAESKSIKAIELLLQFPGTDPWRRDNTDRSFLFQADVRFLRNLLSHQLIRAILKNRVPEYSFSQNGRSSDHEIYGIIRAFSKGDAAEMYASRVPDSMGQLWEDGLDFSD
jgi:ankyrin repeat protein